ncbi:unnamed protein product [Calypogeia fissa]
MSSTSTTHKTEYLVIIPDHPDSLHKRLAVREKHLESITPHVQSIRRCGLRRRHSLITSEGRRAAGHEGQCDACQGGERGGGAGDIYAKGGPWNLNEVKIYPFRSAIRTAIGHDDRNPHPVNPERRT